MELLAPIMFLLVVLAGIVAAIVVYWEREKTTTQIFGTWEREEATCLTAPGVSCLDAGQRNVLEVCQPNESTGLGCIGSDGKVTYLSRQSQEVCDPTCVLSAWDIKDTSPECKVDGSVPDPEFCLPVSTIGERDWQLDCVPVNGFGLNLCNKSEATEIISGGSGDKDFWDIYQKYTTNEAPPPPIKQQCTDFGAPLCGRWLTASAALVKDACSDLVGSPDPIAPQTFTPCPIGVVRDDNPRLAYNLSDACRVPSGKELPAATHLDQGKRGVYPEIMYCEKYGQQLNGGRIVLANLIPGSTSGARVSECTPFGDKGCVTGETVTSYINTDGVVGEGLQLCPGSAGYGDSVTLNNNVCVNLCRVMLTQPPPSLTNLESDYPILNKVFGKAFVMTLVSGGVEYILALPKAQCTTVIIGPVDPPTPGECPIWQCPERTKLGIVAVSLDTIRDADLEYCIAPPGGCDSLSTTVVKGKCGYSDIIRDTALNFFLSPNNTPVGGNDSFPTSLALESPKNSSGWCGLDGINMTWEPAAEVQSDNLEYPESPAEFGVALSGYSTVEDSPIPFATARFSLRQSSAVQVVDSMSGDVYSATDVTCYVVERGAQPPGQPFFADSASTVGLCNLFRS